MSSRTRRSARGRIVGGGLAAAAVAGGVLALAGPASANHPVFVEGNCFGPGAGMTATGLKVSPVPPGTCGDYDGDGAIGVAEDTDGDNTYGTINGALAAVAQNGRVTIVASGTFPEIVTINPTAGGNVTLSAAPGVEANIDAVVQGQPGGPDRAAAPGIIIDGEANTRVTVRDVTTRNWTAGVLVRGQSRALLSGILAENNLNYGIQVVDQARVAIRDSEISASGFRKDAGGVGAPNPGIGIEFEDQSKGSIYSSSVTGSFAAGISASRRAVEILKVQLFDNNPNVSVGGKDAKARR